MLHGDNITQMLTKQVVLGEELYWECGKCPNTHMKKWLPAEEWKREDTHTVLLRMTADGTHFVFSSPSTSTTYSPFYTIGWKLTTISLKGTNFNLRPNCKHKNIGL